MDYATGKIADYEFGTQMIAQCKAVLMTLVWSGVGSFILYKVVDVMVGLRPSVEQEREGLDLTDHGERAYTTVSRHEIRLGRRPGTALAVGGGPSASWGLSLLRVTHARHSAHIAPG